MTTKHDHPLFTRMQKARAAVEHQEQLRAEAVAANDSAKALGVRYETWHGAYSSRRYDDNEHLRNKARLRQRQSTERLNRAKMDAENARRAWLTRGDTRKRRMEELRDRFTHNAENVDSRLEWMYKGLDDLRVEGVDAGVETVLVMPAQMRIREAQREIARAMKMIENAVNALAESTQTLLGDDDDATDD